jgi:hypothetical protein
VDLAKNLAITRWSRPQGPPQVPNLAAMVEGCLAENRWKSHRCFSENPNDSWMKSGCISDKNDSQSLGQTKMNKHEGPWLMYIQQTLHGKCIFH